MPSRDEAKNALDLIIKKSRVHLYKPIQIAEILHHDRLYNDVNLLDLDTYRTQSKKWRDTMCIALVGRTSTSSAKYQDDVFDAMPPELLNELGKENRRTGGAVESYIYKKFAGKHQQLRDALDYCRRSRTDDFSLKVFVDSFWEEPGLRRSIDKIYEVIVHSLFLTLVDAMELKVEISVDESKVSIMGEFEDFTKKVMCLDYNTRESIQDAKIYRVGVTNAADRGLDMYSNWGPAIQIKHLSLDEKLAEEIVTSISSDRIVIVCKDAEKGVIMSLLTQIGWREKIQSIITEDDLINWYDKALRGNYANLLGEELLNTLREEISEEFPSVSEEIPSLLRDRNYSQITDSYWQQ